MKKKYSDFFTNAKKTLSQKSIERVEDKASKILFRINLKGKSKEQIFADFDDIMANVPKKRNLPEWDRI